MTLNPREKIVFDLFTVYGALRMGHFVYASGNHGTMYVDKATIASRPELIAFLASELEYQLQLTSWTTVVSPAVGAISLGHSVALARANHWKEPIKFLYAEKVGDGFELKRGYDRLVNDEATIVVEDILTTGASARAVVDAVARSGGTVMTVAALWNRGGVRPIDLGVPRIIALLNIPLEQWPVEECPLCKEFVPINTEVGHGAKFLERQQSKP